MFLFPVKWVIWFCDLVLLFLTRGRGLNTTITTHTCTQAQHIHANGDIGLVTVFFKFYWHYQLFKSKEKELAKKKEKANSVSVSPPHYQTSEENSLSFHTFTLRNSTSTSKGGTLWKSTFQTSNTRKILEKLFTWVDHRLNTTQIHSWIAYVSQFRNVQSSN